MKPNAVTWKDGLRIGAETHVGMVRGNNQDNMVVSTAASRNAWMEKGHLFIVADGMGAHAAGELASKIAVDRIPLTYRKRTDLPPHEALAAAIEAGHTAIFERGQGSEEFRGMGTTVSALVLLPQAALIGHVGDSRVYRLRDGRYEQLTFDHSLSWEFRAAGQFEDEEAAAYVPKNIITRSLGPKEDVEIDLEGPFPLQAGDTFLLCSDGLSGFVEDEEMAVVIETLPPEEAAQVLVDMANLRGGRDNITVIVVRLAEPCAVQPGKLRLPRKAGDGKTGDKKSGDGNGGGLAATVRGMFGWFRNAGLSRAGSDRLGKGPYVRYDDLPYDAVVKKVSEMLRDLRDAAIRQDWPVDWYKWKQYENRIHAASDSMPKDRVAAYGRAIHFLMSQLSK